MALFGRKKSRTSDEPADQEVDDSLADGEGDDFDGDDDGRPLRPKTDDPTADDLARVERAVAELESAGVDLDSLDSLGAAYDAAVLARTEENDVLAERFGLGVGEYLVRHGGMSWQVVTDMYGSDLGVLANRGTKTAIPTNLVAARLMMSETGWLPRAVAHLARVSRG